MKSKNILAMVLTVALGGAASLALAQSGGNGHGQAGGKSASSMSNKGMLNTNGPEAADRDTGKARAADRHAMHHGKKGLHHKKHKQHPVVPSTS